MNIKLPKLNFKFNDFEPYLDSETIKIHYLFYHKSYVNNLNKFFIKNPDLNKFSLIFLLKNINKIPIKTKKLFINNAGGYINHNFFWESLGNNKFIHNLLMKCINDSFGNFQEFKIEFEKLALSYFGSGWIWLILNNNKLSILTTYNQDNPIMGYNFCKTFGFPILNLDLWEHSYYLKYKSNKISYIKSFWNIINWKIVSNRFLNIKFNR